jgi:hypothetical protein
MTHEAIALPPPVQQIVDLAVDACWRGRRALVAQYGRPADMTRSNAGAFADLGWALVRVRRLAKILRYVFVTLAAWLEVKLRTAGALAGNSRADGTTACRRGAGGPATLRKPRFAISTPYRVRYDDGTTRPQPAHLAHAQPNKLRTLARRLEALTEALLDPMPYVRRLARKLHRDVCFIPYPARRLPRTDRRADLDDLDDVREQARFELWRLRGKREDTS